MFIPKKPKIQNYRMGYKTNRMYKLQSHQLVQSSPETPHSKLPYKITKNQLPKEPLNKSTQFFHTVEFRFDQLTPKSVQKKNLTNHTVALKQKKKIQLQRRINPYTHTQYLCFRTQKNQQKQQEKIINRQEKINKILKPFEVFQFDITRSRPKRAHSYYARPRTTAEKKSASQPRTAISSSRMNINEWGRAGIMDLQIKPWGQEVNIIRKF